MEMFIKKFLGYPLYSTFNSHLDAKHPGAIICDWESNGYCKYLIDFPSLKQFFFVNFSATSKMNWDSPSSAITVFFSSKAFFEKASQKGSA